VGTVLKFLAKLQIPTDITPVLGKKTTQKGLDCAIFTFLREEGISN
jgi:hypothetical protein